MFEGLQNLISSAATTALDLLVPENTEEMTSPKTKSNTRRRGPEYSDSRSVGKPSSWRPKQLDAPDAMRPNRDQHEGERTPSFPPSSPDASQLKHPPIEVERENFATSKVISRASDAAVKHSLPSSDSIHPPFSQTTLDRLVEHPAERVMSSASDAANHGGASRTPSASLPPSRSQTPITSSEIPAASTVSQTPEGAAPKRPAPESPPELSRVSSKRPTGDSGIQAPAPTHVARLPSTRDAVKYPARPTRSQELQQQNNILKGKYDDTKVKLREEHARVKESEKIVEQLKCERMSDTAKINDMSLKLSRQQHDMDRLKRSFQEALQKKQADCAHNYSQWLAWEKEASKWKGDAESLNEMANAHKLKIEAQAHEIDHLKRSLEAKAKKEQQLEDLLSMRNTEAEVTEKVLGVKDTMSEADVKGMVERLNSEIYNLSALIMDSLSLEDGSDAADDLEVTIQNDLQMRFTRVCVKHAMEWTESQGQYDLVQQVNTAIRIDDLKLAGKWVKMTKRAIYKCKDRTSQYAEQDLVQMLQNQVERTLRTRLPDRKLELSPFSQAFESTANLTCKLSKAVWEDVNSVDLQVYIARSGDVFNPETMMVEARGGTVDGKSIVKRTTDIGLKSKAGDGTESRILLKAQVVVGVPV